MSDRVGLLIADIIMLVGFSVPLWFALYECIGDIRKRCREGRMSRAQWVIAGVLGVMTVGLFVLTAFALYYKHYWRLEE